MKPHLNCCTSEALRHVFYEADELLELCKYLQGRIIVSETILRNAVLEKALIHTRNLIDFFECTKKNDKASDGARFREAKKDDIICEDYGYTPRLLVVPKDIRQRINKRVAHLTYSRSRPPLDRENTDFRDNIDFIPAVLDECKKFFSYILSSNLLVLPRNLSDSIIKFRKKEIPDRGTWLLGSSNIASTSSSGL